MKNVNAEPIETRIIDSVAPAERNPRQIAREFTDLLASGVRFNIVGEAKSNPKLLFEHGLTPKYKIDLFSTSFYLTNVRQIPELRFLIAYIVQPRDQSRPPGRGNRSSVSARIIYKDLSLVWRTASHFTFVDDQIWIGKGDVYSRIVGDHEYISSNESTTDLPLEILSALERLNYGVSKPRNGRRAIELILQRAKGDRMLPFAEFTTPRRRAFENPKNRIYGGRSIARFTRKNDPRSLKIVRGFEPDFSDGIVEKSFSKSSMYGGDIARYRILSSNRRIQYYFLAGPRHVWIIPPQALTTELSSFGLRTIDVVADDDLFVPGYEYHYYEDTPTGPQLHSQIPPGFVGDICPVHEDKADASPWLDAISVIRKFRRHVLGQMRK